MTGDVEDETGVDPVLLAILRVLWDHARSGQGNALSLARVGKRAGVRMSVLRRVLTQLAEADLVATTMEEDGRGTTRLTEDGEALCGQLFEAPGAEGAPVLQ